MSCMPFGRGHYPYSATAAKDAGGKSRREQLSQQATADLRPDWPTAENWAADCPTRSDGCRGRAAGSALRCCALISSNGSTTTTATLRTTAAFARSCEQSGGPLRLQGIHLSAARSGRGRSQTAWRSVAGPGIALGRSGGVLSPGYWISEADKTLYDSNSLGGNCISQVTMGLQLQV